MNGYNVLVSVVVPVYNVEYYIEKCVQSLLQQDHEQIEIILVDDGSPDGSGIMIDKLALQDLRIIAIHQTNRGVSSARNTGIDAAHGDYIMFVDGDDWVESDYVSYYLNLVTECGCDIGMGTNNYSIYSSVSSDSFFRSSAEKTIEWIYSERISVAVWNKIYRRSLLEQYNIRFNENIWYGEGMLFNIECLQKVDSVAIGEKSVYHQYFNPKSATRKFNLESNMCGIRSLSIQKERWDYVTPQIEKEWVYHRYRFNRSIIDGLVRSNMIEDYKDVYKECIKNIRKGFMIPLTTEHRIKTKIGWVLYIISPYIMARRAAKVHNRLLEKSLGGGYKQQVILCFAYMPINYNVEGACA